MIFYPQIQIEQNQLIIDGCRCTDLAEKYGTPLYVLSLTAMEEHFCEIRHDFLNKYPSTRAAYAAKAFLTTSMCHIVEKNDFCLDVVSGGELYTAMAAKFPPERIEFNGNNKLEFEIMEALNYGVGRIIVDSADELELLEELCQKENKKAKILFRITPGIQGDSHDYIITGRKDSKFGFPLDSSLMEAIRKAIASQHVELLGFHFHVGSQFHDNEVYLQAVDIVLNLVHEAKEHYGYVTREINLGGGFGIAYIPEEKRLPYSYFLDPMMEKIIAAFESMGLPVPAVVIEPGRSIVGDAGLTLYTIGSIKDIPQLRTYVSVDGGMMDNIRPALYHAKYHAILANRAAEEANKVVTICGKACESGDILIKDLPLPFPKRGDLLSVFATGAYGYSMASNYNKIPVPAVVLVKEGKSQLMVRRQTMEDLIQRDENIEEMLEKGSEE